MMLEQLKDEFKKMSDKIIFDFKEELSRLRTGRASLALLDTIKVDYYNNMVSLKEVATLSVPQAQVILIQPWESKMIPIIEKAINKANLGLVPANDGKVIRLSLPSLTEERRDELIKVVKQETEKVKVLLRNVRRDINEEIKTAFKDKHMSEDDNYKFQEEIKKMLDSTTAKLDEIFEHKVKEIKE